MSAGRSEDGRLIRDCLGLVRFFEKKEVSFCQKQYSGHPE